MDSATSAAILMRTSTVATQAEYPTRTDCPLWDAYASAERLMYACGSYRLWRSAAAMASVSSYTPSLGANLTTAVGAARPATAATRRPSGATVAMARFVSIACATALPTSTGERVVSPLGGLRFVSAHMPASRIGPGCTTETPTPWGANSPRSDSA